MEIRDDRKLFHEREENLLKFNHPNVVKMFHIESDSVFKYYALELCEASLDKLFLKGDELEKYHGPRLHNMPQPQVVFSQLAEGLAYIHKMGIAHRDVKPANVLFYVKYRSIKTNQESESDQKQIDQVIFKWADFGTSKKVNVTGDCSMSGFKFSQNWCAPEVLKIYSNGSSQSAGIKSDVFSEGLIFSCYLLKGEHPYGNWIDVLGNLKENKPQKLNEIPDEHKTLKELIETMLKTNPFERPPSKEVAEKLELGLSTFVNVSTALDTASDFSSSSIKTRSITIEKETELGRGTFSVVYKGYYDGVGSVAIKRIQLDDSNNQEDTQMILNNQNNTCQNIVKLYHVENDDVFKFFALELCAASLDKLFLPPKDPRKYNGQKPKNFELMSQLAFGLEYIHSKDFVFRNIKPENVLISVDTTGKKITMKWGDFGFSKSKSEQGSWSFSGSAVNQMTNWLAPELQDHFYEERTKGNTKMSDIFSEGLLFCYFLLEGQHPFGSSHFTISMNIANNKAVNFEKIESSCYRDIILKMLKPNPKDRITSSELVAFVQSKEKDLERTLFDLLEETPLNLTEIGTVISEGVNINCVNENGLTPLFCLIQKEEDDLMQVIPLFLQHGIDVNHKDEDGWNVLFFLCHHYQEDNLIEINSLLLEHDVDVNCKDNNGKNILHFYCSEYKRDNFIDIVNVFIEKGVEVVSGVFDATRMVSNKKYPKRSNVDKIIALMNKNC